MPAAALFSWVLSCAENTLSDSWARRFADHDPRDSRVTVVVRSVHASRNGHIVLIYGAVPTV